MSKENVEMCNLHSSNYNKASNKNKNSSLFIFPSSSKVFIPDSYLNWVEFRVKMGCSQQQQLLYIRGKIAYPIHVQAALVIRGLLIFEFAYSHWKK